MNPLGVQDSEKGEEGANLPSPGFADVDSELAARSIPAQVMRRNSPPFSLSTRTCSGNGVVCGCKWKSGLNLKHHTEPDPKLKVHKVGVLNELRETKFEHRAKCLFRRLGCLVLRNLGKLNQINSFRRR